MFRARYSYTMVLPTPGRSIFNSGYALCAMLSRIVIGGVHCLQASDSSASSKFGSAMVMDGDGSLIVVGSSGKAEIYSLMQAVRHCMDAIPAARL
jgi:hypothetical protein